MYKQLYEKSEKRPGTEKIENPLFFTNDRAQNKIFNVIDVITKIKM